MKRKKSDKHQILDSDKQGIRGQSHFRNLQISWIFSEQFGLTVANIRCGVCSMPLEPVAVKVGKETYLVCEDGHLVGSATMPQRGIPRQFTKRHEYNQKVEEVIRLFRETYSPVKV